MNAKDLAKKLGLSPSTVSMVLNNKPGISAKTRQRILDAIAESGFKHTKSQATKNTVDTMTICFLIFKRDIQVKIEDSQFFSKVIEGLETEANDYGYQMNISYISNNALEGVRPLLNSVRNGELSGLIILATEMTDADVKRISDASIDLPVVILDFYTDEKIDTIYLDNKNATMRATEHLINGGHTEIGFLNSTFWIHNMEKRFEGYKAALNKHNLEFRDEFYFELNPTIDDGRIDMLKHLKKAKKLPSAFIASNDIIAIAALSAIQDFGLKIPEDISIIGFDDIPFCSILNPSLSTIRIQKERMGKLAVIRLLERIDSLIPERITLRINSDLVIRDSVIDKNKNLAADNTTE